MVLVRPGTRVDEVPVVALWRVAAADRRSGQPVVDTHEERVRAFFRDFNAFLVVSDTEQGALLGAAVGRQALADDGTGPPVPGLLHISMVLVRPDRWGQGLGSVLLDTTLDEARLREYERAQLWAHADSARAHRLCESRKFFRTGRERADRDGHPIVQFHRGL
jgi:GNAT superfamily N-acetyltransferase